jgi:hypothetical protein
MWRKDKTTNEIEFVALDKYAFEVCPKPFPASQAIPQWWKDASPYVKSPQNPDGKKIIIENRESNASFKKCTPMLDLLSSGYIVPLWADVQIKNEDDGHPSIKWRVQKNVFELHNGQEVEIPDGYQKAQFKFLNQWVPKLPKGYSALIIACPGYPNNPFRAMQAIIDYDKTTHPLYPPMFLKEGFEGILEKGTPMFQIIPFKRNNWESKFSFLKNGQDIIDMDRDVKATLVNNYVKNFWEKKSYK